MSLCETIQRFLEANETAIKSLDEQSREFVVMSCRIMYLRNLLCVLVCDPPNEDIIQVRAEFHKLFKDKEYVGKGHEHLVQQFDKGEKILF
jgi:hypothetical protein